MRTIWCVIVLNACIAAVTWAQSTAQIHGVVQDPTGAADVKATQTDTGVSRSVSSDAAGAFVLTNLPLGLCRPAVGKEGFASSLNRDFVLEVGSNPGFTVTLKVGSTSGQINVNITDLIGLARASVPRIER